jgi:adenylate cyclase
MTPKHMVDENVTRKLAAILCADVAGYSRLTGADEEGTYKQLNSALDLLSETIDSKGGRVVNTAGDAVLAEFGSVVLAVDAAATFQRTLRERNADVPEDRRLQFRIGINLGEVIIECGDIYGDGVNIAARLESIAEAGGICVSSVVYEQVKGKIDLGFRDIGPQQFKNIKQPVAAYQVLFDEESARDTLPVLPDRPSIAVLPFDNMSDDPAQEIFADGMTEDIITGLSKFRWLFVIARNSTFAYKGRAVEVRQVARELGVRYVLEGSVRVASQRIRATGQLIDAETGNHIWAERYDRQLEDIFDIQDELTEAIVSAIAPEIGEAEIARARRKPPDSLNAWDLYQKGLAAFYSSTEESFKSAMALFDKVNEFDPTFGPGYAMAAISRARYILHFEPDDRDVLLDEARENAQRAIKLDPNDPLCLWIDGRVHSMMGDNDAAISQAQKAVALNPNDALSRFNLGVVLCTAGRTEEAIPHSDHAMRVSPRDAFMPGMIGHRAFCEFDIGHYEEALTWINRALLSPNPRTMTFAILAAVLQILGREDEARATIDALLMHAPGMTCTKYRDNTFGTPEAMKKLVAALREAGLPE